MSLLDDVRKRIGENLTFERALEVRVWRCNGDGATWRSIAGTAFRAWGRPDWLNDENQIDGMVLCELAASMLAEDSGEDPWN